MCQKAHSPVSERLPCRGPARPRRAQGCSRARSERRTMRRSQRGLVGRGGGLRGAGSGRPGRAGGGRNAERAARESEAGGDRGSRPCSRRALQKKPRSEPNPAAAAPPSLPASPRPRSDVPAERAVRRRPPRDALSGERRRHGGKRSVPPFQLSPLPLPAPGRSSGRFPSPFMPGRRPPAALPSAPASPPPPFPGSPPR